MELVFEKVVLPWDYLDGLRGVLYQAMKRGVPKLAEQLHHEGVRMGSKRYKFLTFSLLYPKRYQVVDNGLLMEGVAKWWISSLIVGYIEAIALGLLAQPEGHLLGRPYFVRQVRVEALPQFNSRMHFVTLSPISVSTGVREGDKFSKRFLSPEEADFGRVISLNLGRKAKALDMEVEGRVEVKWINWQSKLLTVNRTQIRGWNGSFVVEGPGELLRLGYEAGFGEHTASGFGMVEVKREAI